MRVLLVAMPFGMRDRPSLALGLLTATLRRAGIDCEAAYLSLAFAGQLGVETYDVIAETMPEPAMAGDWVFTDCLYKAGSPRPDDYVGRVLRAGWQLDHDVVEAVLAARSLAPRFLSSVIEELRWSDYDLIGFTCSSGQTIASLALARLLKQRHPRLLTVLGGPAWHGVMGRTLLASFPFVDAACLGEGDVAFPSFVRALAEDRPDAAGKTPGMLARRSRRAAHHRPEELIGDLDELPIPDYTDYARALAGYGPPERGVVIPAETSRGCWWAAGEPCRFCGLNGPHRTYRTKSAGRVLNELRILAEQPGCRLLDIVDSVASPALLTTVFPQLANDPLPVPLKMDIRPDVGRRTVELLAEADASVLAGIESLSDRVLTLMNKGTHTLENVRFLKWCEARGLRASWNLLYGFPGETAADDEDIMGVLEAITHLSPPDACGPVRIERFSTYFEDPESYGFVNVRPATAYSYLFPFAEDTLASLAYFFEHDYAPGFKPPLKNYGLRSFVYHWRAAAPRGELRQRSGNILVDSRRPNDTMTYHLDELERLLYSACDDLRRRTELQELAHRSGMAGDGLAERVDGALASFVERGLMLRRDDLFLSLALPEPAPPCGTPAAVSSEKEQGRPRVA